VSSEITVSDAEPGTAEREGELALAAVFQALDDRKNFVLEAGAGAGKTYSLIAALRRILENPGSYIARPDQKIACLTYTKVARDEIIRRTDASPRVFADTLHGFLWEMIAPFQRSLAQAVLHSPEWAPVLDGRVSLEGLGVEYDLGIRGIGDDAVRLHHDDVPRIAIKLFAMPKFRSLITDRFPIIFIDEYQDTPDGLIEALLSGGASTAGPLLGFFGDEWQQIYDKTAGPVKHPEVLVIEKNANFRSDRVIVDYLNGLRPELKQKAASDARPGTENAEEARGRETSPQTLRAPSSTRWPAMRDKTSGRMPQAIRKR
jgi:DNA helicase-2/ATP-dependent DNA helicase PcrA